jgi:hypothetical protein
VSSTSWSPRNLGTDKASTQDVDLYVASRPKAFDEPVDLLHPAAEAML